MGDSVNHPSHYETGKFECIDVMVETQGTEAAKNFCVGNAFKYLYRHKNKNGLEDVKKAQWYINKYIELCDCQVTNAFESLEFDFFDIAIETHGIEETKSFCIICAFEQLYYQEGLKNIKKAKQYIDKYIDLCEPKEIPSNY